MDGLVTIPIICLYFAIGLLVGIYIEFRYGVNLRSIYSNHDVNIFDACVFLWPIVLFASISKDITSYVIFLVKFIKFLGNELKK